MVQKIYNRLPPSSAFPIKNLPIPCAGFKQANESRIKLIPLIREINERERERERERGRERERAWC